MNKLKVDIVGIVGVPSNYGGFETLVDNLLDGFQKEKDFSVRVYCSSKAYKNKQKTYKSAELFYLPIRANGVQSVIYDSASLILSIFNRPNVILVLGVSGGIVLPIVKLFSSARVIVNIDGIEWKRGKWGAIAKKYLRWSERVCVAKADIVVSDIDVISDYVKKEYGRDSVVIEYGGDHAIDTTGVAAHESGEDEYALCLCRIEPENNISLILEAYDKSKMEIPLKFVGNWNSSEYGREIKSKYLGHKNVKLLDPIFDKTELYRIRRGCSLYIHGHSAGGTNPSLVEIMHFGVPVYCFDCEFNRSTTEDNARYFSDVDSLVDLLNETSVSDGDSSGHKMREVAQRKFLWSVIYNKYRDVMLKI